MQGSYFNLTQEWLVRHKYPPGPIHLTRTHLPTLPIYYSVGNFKVCLSAGWHEHVLRCTQLTRLCSSIARGACVWCCLQYDRQVR